jgi:hypothetical protein
MKKNLFVVLAILVLSLGALAETKVIKVMSDQRRFTLGNDEGLTAGQKILLVGVDGSKAVAEVVECKLKSCLAKITNPKSSFVIDQKNKVTIIKGKRKFAVAGSLDNALGLTYGLAGYYNFPHAPYMLGFKFRQIDNETSDINVTGQTLSLELQRYLWSKSRFQLWATAEAGLMKIELDLSGINADEPAIKKTEYFGSLGLEGRWNVSDRFRIVAGGGIIMNTLEKSYSGKSGDYDLEFETLYLTAKLGVMYFF